MYIAGKLSRPGLYENLSTNNIRREEIDNPGSIVAFFTSRPSCRNTEKIGEGIDGPGG
jgi:hypothetical protein